MYEYVNVCAHIALVQKGGLRSVPLLKAPSKAVGPKQGTETTL